MIDVGGPSMLRGAAKNFAHVRAGLPARALRLRARRAARERRALARDAPASSRPRRSRHTAAYEAAIATWFAEREAFPDTLVVSLEKVLDLAYGENPHQRAAYYAERGARAPPPLARRAAARQGALVQQPQRPLRARGSLAREFALPACVIVKHANPCGVAIGATVEEAYDKALASDPTSAYGGVVVLNREVEDAARREARRAVRRGAVRARLQRRRARRAAAQAEHAHPPRPRAPRRRGRASAATSACSAACSSRIPTRRSTTARAGRSSPAQLDERAVGRPRLRVARLQARLLERDRARRRISRRSGSAPAR